MTLNDPEASQENTSDTIGVIDSQNNLGQSFISRRPDLNGMTIWLSVPSSDANESTDSNSNTINVKLYLQENNSVPVFSTTLITPATGNDFPLTISFPEQKNPAGQGYYILLSKSSGTIQVNGRNEDAYPSGQAYINGKPANADFAFRLSYDYDFAALAQDILQGLTYSWLVIPLMIILWLPGWLLLDLCGFRSHFDFGEQTAISVGISIAVIPVVMLWTSIIKLRWSSRVILFIAVCLSALFVARIVYRYFANKKSNPIPNDSSSTGHGNPTSKIIKYIFNKSLALVLIFIFTLTIRLIMVRDLATPAWVDSVHHALITRLIMNAGAYPSTYLPYLDIPTSAYHPGFHSIAATFTWLTNLNLAQSLLILGQVLNALNVFSVYLFTTTLIHKPSVGLLAAIATGFLTPMPAYYTSWGRYTELTGVLILPVVLALIQLYVKRNSEQKVAWIIILGAITAGGLFMIHYRVILFLVALILSYFIIFGFFRGEYSQIKPVQLLLFISATALLGLLTVLPWLLQTVKTTVLPMVNTKITATVPLFQDFSWPYLTSAYGKQVTVLAGLGLLWGMIKRRNFAFIILVWILFIFFLANLVSFRLPGGGLINNTSVEIMLFIPISALAGYFFDQVLVGWASFFPKKLTNIMNPVVIILVGFVSFLGARQLITIINPVTILSRNADLAAIEWISVHIPENETIVINPFAWGYGLFAGNDGGYWISPLTGRQTLPPPVLYGLGSGVNNINQVSQQILTTSSDPTDLWKYLNAQHLHYIYTGAKGGAISPELLTSSGLFSVLYHVNGVWVFGVKP